MVRLWFLNQPIKGGSHAVRITVGEVILGLDEWIAAIVGWTKHAVVYGNGAWIVSTYEARLFTFSQAVALLSLAQRLAAWCGEYDSRVIGWRGESVTGRP